MQSTPLPSGTHHSFLVCGTTFVVPLRYTLIKPIGHGSYGVVCSAERADANGQSTKVAIKKITSIFSNLVETKRTLREVKLLRFFEHANIIALYDVFVSPANYQEFTDLYLVSELMNTDLHQIITSKQPLSDEHVQYFLYQLLRGLKYVHSAGVIHRDLKPSNLLLNANCDLKICDFGLARQASQQGDHAGFLTEYVATRWYRAPEIMLSWKAYGSKIDVWSVGCILAEILQRKPLFPGRDYMHQLHLIIDTLGSPSDADSDYIASDKAKTYIRSLPHRARVDFKQLLPQVTNMHALDLLSRMLHFAPEQRISVAQALEHPYLAQLHDASDEPECQRLVDFDLEDEQRISTQHQHLPQLTPAQQKEQLKQLLWAEVCILHPELKGQEHQAKSGAASSAAPVSASTAPASAATSSNAMQQ